MEVLYLMVKPTSTTFSMRWDISVIYSSCRLSGNDILKSFQDPIGQNVEREKKLRITDQVTRIYNSETFQSSLFSWQQRISQTSSYDTITSKFYFVFTVTYGSYKFRKTNFGKFLGNHAKKCSKYQHYRINPNKFYILANK